MSRRWLRGSLKQGRHPSFDQSRLGKRHGLGCPLSLLRGGLGKEALPGLEFPSLSDPCLHFLLRQTQVAGWEPCQQGGPETWLGESAPSDPRRQLHKPKKPAGSAPRPKTAFQLCPQFLHSPGALGQDSHLHCGLPSPNTLAQGSVN